MANLRMLIPELIGSQSSLIAATSAASASTPAMNLKTSEPWEIWRSTQDQGFRTILSGRITGGPPLAINAVAMDGLNMIPGNGQVRAVLVDTVYSVGVLNLFQEMVPTAIVTSTGISGVVGDVNEGSGATDNAYITEDDATVAASVVFDFGTPAANPETGALNQFFALRVRATYGAASSQPYTALDTSGSAAYRRPSVSVYLVEDVAGTPTTRAYLGTKAVFGTDAHWLIFPWDAADLATANGSNVQVRVQLHGIAPVSPDTAEQSHPDLDSLFWGAACGQVASLDVVADSGWSYILPDALSGVGTDYSTQLGNFYSRWQTKFAPVKTAKQVLILLREDHVPKEDHP